LTPPFRPAGILIHDMVFYPGQTEFFSETSLYERSGFVVRSSGFHQHVQRVLQGIIQCTGLFLIPFTSIPDEEWIKKYVYIAGKVGSFR
jgi:hypothetical protein